MHYVGKDLVVHGSLLHLDRNVAWQELRSRAKQGIRKARKAGIRVEESRDLGQMAKLWYDPETLTTTLDDDQKLYLAYVEDELVGGIIVTPVTSNTLFYHYGGTNEKGREIEANAYLFWHVVEQFHDSPYEFLDVGVSYRSELQHYFQKYCTQPYPILFNPPPENVRPRIAIEPFSATDMFEPEEPIVAINTRLSEFFESEFTFMPSWDFALQSALRALKLKPHSEIGVWASIGESSYLAELNRLFGDEFKFVSRDPRATAYLVAHRWGIACPDAELLALEDKPLIEDCRDALGSHEHAHKPGSFGKYAVFDFSRWFPMSSGAVLVGDYFSDRDVWNHFHCLDIAKRNAAREALQIHWPHRTEYLNQRAGNTNRFQQLFRLIGMNPVAAAIPLPRPVFLLKSGSRYQAADIGRRLRQFDIACELDPEDNVIALPCHCRMSSVHVEYIFGAVRGMINPCCQYIRQDPHQQI